MASTPEQNPDSPPGGPGGDTERVTPVDTPRRDGITDMPDTADSREPDGHRQKSGDAV